MLTRKIVGLCLGLILSHATVAQTVYQVSIGSYKNQTNAENAAAKAARELGDGYSVEAAQTGSGSLYRVLSEPVLSRSAADVVSAKARRANITGAWVLKRNLPVAASKVNATGVSSRSLPNTQNPQSLPTLDSPSESGTKISSTNSSTNKDNVNAPRSGVQPLNGRKGIRVSLAGQSGGVTEAGALNIRRTDEAQTPFKIDGILDEPIWREINAIDDFVVVEPDTLKKGTYATNVKIAYTDEGLYVAAEMEQPEETLIRRLSGRDIYSGLNRDSINITLDTSGEGLYGFWFGINLGDSLMDGSVLPERRFSNEWDGPWRGASAQNDSGWSAEFFIPWSAISMPKAADTRNMGIFLSRKVAHLDERWGFPALPNTTPKFLSALQTIEMQGVAPRQQYNIYPFAAATADQIDDETRYRVGADMFWRPSSNFQLNATVNPDFGNVESDDVVINLSATETFFPEKRLFFVEGQEIFVASPRADTRSSGVGQGGPPTTLVNTRRIGGRPQVPTLALGQTVSSREQNLPVDLLGAAKATGQIGKFRYGVLGAFEDEVELETMVNNQPVRLNQDGSNYGIGRLLYENGSGGSYKAVGVLSTVVEHQDRSAYVTGVDAHYLSANGKLQTDSQIFRSDLTDSDVGYGGFIDFEYTFRQGVQQRLGIEHFDDNVNINDLGYQARNNYTQVRTAHTRTSSDLTWARNNQFDIRGAVQENGDGFLTRAGIFLSNRATFNNLTSITGRISHFAPGYDDLNSFGNGVYRIEEKTAAGLSFDSNSAKAVSFGVGLGYEEEDLGGDSYYYHANVNWRPLDGLSVGAGLRYLDRDGWLLHQENRNFTTFSAEQWQPNLNVEYFLSAKQQFKISVQWVGIRAEEDDFYLSPAISGDLIATTKPAGPSDSFSISDMVFQARYRWEIAPLSDLFIVYSRTSDLTQALRQDNFDDLLDNAWQEPVGDQFVMKIRYRFGS
ncbi:carbohydrate binding family 9 domain-containing protein [Pseudomonadales bacterium]|nr:carbohydrate binding family 9 domain-containing protein [Pseudomonadales bacterium]